ncbi:MAG: WD40 repeat domain-containing protein [Haliscomenobacter sp.]|uniref:WD40 repeat domain-containing protein n=1 Tax=Haliscomenobacter sp. TaxID=2717303 RepID=UPI0029AC1C50|nr:WD40 repeat domain-containing protein [Haliscomenobacter sp.]MDX2069827.1 WD40 repeat domain-containing protein [Haliscomenobacter sp.]
MKAFLFVLIFYYPCVAMGQIPCGLEEYNKNLASARKAYLQGHFRSAYNQFTALKGCEEGQKELNQLNAKIKLVLDAIENDEKASSMLVKAHEAEKAGKFYVALHWANEACNISKNGNNLALQKRAELLNKELIVKNNTGVGYIGRIRTVASSNNDVVQSVGKEDTLRAEILARIRHSAKITSLAFSPDGQFFVSGNRDSTAKLWNLQGKEICTFKGHRDQVYDVAFSPNGKLVLTGSRDGTAKLWNLQGDSICTFKGHSKIIYDVAFSPNGKFVLTGSMDGKAKLWNLKGKDTLTFLKSWKYWNMYIHAVAFSPDGKLILTGGDDGIAKLWNFKDKKIQSFKKHTNKVSSVAFSPDGQCVLTGSLDGTVKLWNLKGEEKKTFKRDTAQIYDVAFSPDGKFVLIGGTDKTVKLWNLETNEIQDFKGHLNSIFAVTFSPNGKFFLTGGDDSTAILWGPKGNEMSKISEIASGALAPNGKSIFIGSKDKVATLWDLQDQRIGSFKGHSTGIDSVDFSPDGKFLLTGSTDSTARLWDRDGNEIRTFKASSGITSVAFSPDGKFILVGSRDNFIRLWHCDIGGFEAEQAAEYYDFQSQISTIDFSKTGDTILIGTGNQLYLAFNLVKRLQEQKEALNIAKLLEEGSWSEKDCAITQDPDALLGCVQYYFSRGKLNREFVSRGISVLDETKSAVDKLTVVKIKEQLADYLKLLEQ